MNKRNKRSFGKTTRTPKTLVGGSKIKEITRLFICPCFRLVLDLMSQEQWPWIGSNFTISLPCRPPSTHHIPSGGSEILLRGEGPFSERSCFEFGTVSLLRGCTKILYQSVPQKTVQLTLWKTPTTTWDVWQTLEATPYDDKPKILLTCACVVSLLFRIGLHSVFLVAICLSPAFPPGRVALRPSTPGISVFSSSDFQS